MGGHAKGGVVAAMGFALIAIGAFRWLGSPVIKHAPGMLVPEEPVQTPTKMEPFAAGRYNIAPLQDYRIRARVLGKKSYEHDDDGDLIPFDLMLGWGPMSNSSVIDTYHLSQDGRHAFVYGDERSALPFEVIKSKFANLHACPATDWVKIRLSELLVGDIVTLTGVLIRAERGDGYRVVSSTSRDDSQGGACEVMWILDIEIQPRN